MSRDTHVDDSRCAPPAERSPAHNETNHRCPLDRPHSIRVFVTAPWRGAFPAGIRAWSIALDGTVVGVDGAGRVRHQVDLRAASLAYGDHALWVLTEDNHVVRVDATTGEVKQTIAVPSVLTLGGIAAGGGAVWVTSPFQGVLWRIDPGPPSSQRTSILVGAPAELPPPLG